MRIKRGDFDGRLTEQLRKLSREDLELVVHALEPWSPAGARLNPE